jgi:hypothetical protein
MDMMKHHVAQQTVDATIASLASKTTYTGATVTLGGGIGAIINSEPAESATLTLGGWLVSSEGAVVAGIVLGVAGFLVNLFFRRRADAREEREHHARMNALRGQQPGA